MLPALNHSPKKSQLPLNAPQANTLQQSMQKETGHRYTSTSGQEVAELYSPNEDSKAAEPIFCETRQTLAKCRVRSVSNVVIKIC